MKFIHNIVNNCKGDTIRSIPIKSLEKNDMDTDIKYFSLNQVREFLQNNEEAQLFLHKLESFQNNRVNALSMLENLENGCYEIRVKLRYLNLYELKNAKDFQERHSKLISDLELLISDLKDKYNDTIEALNKLTAKKN